VADVPRIEECVMPSTKAKSGSPAAADFIFPDQLDYPMQSVEGKSVLISGGTTGIGRATALLLAARGARVMIFGRHEKELSEALLDLARNGREIHGVIADQADIHDVRKVFKKVDEQFGQIDVLIDNAAIASDAVSKQTLDDIDYAIRADLSGYLTCAREAVKRMEARGSGHIVVIGSISADKRGGDGTVYAAAKAGVQAFAEALTKEVQGKGIKVSLIEPGAVGTDMQPDKSTHARKAREQKMLKAEDIAACVYFCLTQPPRCDITEMKVAPHLQEY
jgi:NADP-dependent 3-hydroxy acid dehydrogenase YdfG